MKRVLLCAEIGSLLLLGAGRTFSAPPEPQAMIVTRSGSQPSNKGSDRYFTGSVRVDPLFQPKEPSRVSGAYVTFEPGARSAWHTHPLGQDLIVTAGTGWVQGMEWREAGDQAGRRGLDATGREALARRGRDQRHDAHRDSGVARR